MVEVMTSESIALLANIIYEREVAEKNPSVFTFFQLRSIAEAKDERLKFFLMKSKNQPVWERKIKKRERN